MNQFELSRPFPRRTLVSNNGDCCDSVLFYALKGSIAAPQLLRFIRDVKMVFGRILGTIGPIVLL
jgi:hypothetical protein